MLQTGSATTVVLVIRMDMCCVTCGYDSIRGLGIVNIVTIVLRVYMYGDGNDKGISPHANYWRNNINVNLNVNPDRLYVCKVQSIVSRSFN